VSELWKGALKMCGICFVFGDNAIRKALNIMVGQKDRGSSSCGLAFIKDNQMITLKSCVEPETFKKKVRKWLKEKPEYSNIKAVLGHNRAPSVGYEVKINNAHPFISCDNRFALVHNGTIHDLEGLRNYLKRCGHKIEGTTDSEVIAHLLEEILKTETDRRRAFYLLSEIIGGWYAFLVYFADGELWGIRHHAPIKIIHEKENYFIASEVQAFRGVENLNGKTRKITIPKEDIPFCLDLKAKRLIGTFEIEEEKIEKEKYGYSRYYYYGFNKGLYGGRYGSLYGGSYNYYTQTDNVRKDSDYEIYFMDKEGEILLDLTNDEMEALDLARANVPYYCFEFGDKIEVRKGTKIVAQFYRDEKEVWEVC